MEHHTQNSLLSRREAAAYLGVKVSTLEKWATTRKGPTYIKVGGLAKYRTSDLEKYLVACTIVVVNDVVSVGDSLARR